MSDTWFAKNMAHFNAADASLGVWIPDPIGGYSTVRLTDEDRLVLANALVDGVYVADPAGLMELIEEYGVQPWKHLRKQIRAALGLAEGEKQ